MIVMIVRSQRLIAREGRLMRLIHKRCGGPVIEIVRYSRLMDGRLDLDNPWHSHHQCAMCDVAVLKEDTMAKKDKVGVDLSGSDRDGDCFQATLVYEH